MNKLPRLTLAAFAALLSPLPISAMDADIISADDLPMAEAACAKKQGDKERKEDEKRAAAWLKTELGQHAEATKLLKEIKGKKTLDKNLQKLRRLYSVDPDTFGLELITPIRPRGNAYLEQEQQHSAELLKAKSRLKKQIDRVRGLELWNDKLDETLEFIEKKHLYNYADGQLNIDMTGGDEVNE